MEKKTIVLLIAVMTLLGAGHLSANSLQNPGFEEGNIGWFGDAGFTVPGWIFWNTDGWCHNNAGAYLDTKAVLMWSDAPGVIQDFAVMEGRDYNFSVSMLSSSTDNFGLRGWDGVFQIEWFDVDNYLIEAAEIGRFYGALTQGSPVDPYNTWKVVSATKKAPVPAVRCRVFLHLTPNGATPSGGSLSFDNVYAGLAYAAENPDPANHGTVDPSVSTTLRWTRPAPRHAGDTIRCDVWFGQDPNMPSTNTKILNKQDADSVVIGMLEGNQTYYWKVDCYDPNNGGVEVKTGGETWTFDTENAAPTVDAGKKQALWLSIGTVTTSLHAATTDDGLPNPPAALSYEWSVVSGPASVTFASSPTVQDPDVTFTAAGTYVFQAAVSDTDKDAADTVVVKVYPEGYTGLVAHWALDDASGTTAVDSAGGHHGTLVGNPVWTAGQLNGAIQLDGDGDYIDCGGGKTDPNVITWADLNDEITVSAWVKATFTKPWQAIINKGDSSWRLFRDNTGDNSLNVSLTLNGIGPVVSGSTGPVGDNRWHQVVGTFDGVYECIYVDGLLAASREIPEGARIDLNDYNVRIGSDEQFDGLREFSGLIDEVRVYEIGLSADKILNQYIADGGTHSCGLTYISGDINRDCYVDIGDLAALANNWLKCSDITNVSCE